MNDEPIFYYVSEEDLARPGGFEHLSLSRHRRFETNQVRVALVRVEPSLVDKAWDEMTEAERSFLSPPWQAQRVPSPKEILRLAEQLREEATRAEGAAKKLEQAAGRVMRDPYEKGGPS